MNKILGPWMPIDASAHGAELDYMTALVHWLMALLFVGWAIYFVYVLFRFRGGRNPRANYHGVKSHFSTWIEGGVVVAEIILLVGFAIPAWARWVTPHPADSDALVVRVIGEQFAWNTHYSGPDGVFGVTDPHRVDAANPVGLDRGSPGALDDVVTINQLHLPVDRPITVLLSSKDVIHSFSLPVMRVKQDAVPGMEIPVHFTAVKTTPEDAKFPGCAATKSCWEIACAQLCGLGHFRMRGYFTVHTQEDFDAWMAAQLAKLEPAPAAAPEAAPTPEEPAPDAETHASADHHQHHATGP